MVTRREFLKLSAAAGGAVYLSNYWWFIKRVKAQGLPLPGSRIPQWVDPLPLLNVAGGPIETILAGTDEISLEMKEFQAAVMPSTFVPALGTYSGTWVWGYRAGIEPENPAGTYIGPVIVATRGVPTQIRFINHLPVDDTSNNVAWREWTDLTLHWADPFDEGMEIGNPNHYLGPIPAVPHLHGGEIPPELDGGPDAWFTSAGGYKGMGYYTHPEVGAGDNEAVYRYPNSQEASLTWFHDHLLGGTRLNVYAGLAGAYPIIDPDLNLPAGLTPVGLGDNILDNPWIPMVIQDRMFDVNGQLYFPNLGINLEHPYWIPEFEGDTIVVNGKVWPFLNVEPKRYRFLFINGSNARAYELFVVNPVTKVMGPPMYQIGTDGGYLDAPVKIDPNAGKGQLLKLILQPGERADVIIDFAGFEGQTLLMRNTANHPYPKGAPPTGTTLGQIVQFRVGPGPVADNSYNPAAGVPLRPPMVRLVNPAAGALAAGVTADKTRQLTLNEVMGMGGPLEVLVNNTRWMENTTELPNEGETEVWEIVNLTADAHPMHLHLVQFQLINRQAFDVSKYNKAYAAAFPGGLYKPAEGPPLDYNTGIPRALGGNPDLTKFLQGPVKPPAANEAGWKDTVQMYPGQVTRIAVRFAPTDKAVGGPDLFYPFDPSAEENAFVWHCHIVDHEDNEMMRPLAVTAKGGVEREFEKGDDY